MRVVWTRRALAELDRIQDHIAKDNPSAAYRTVRTIYDKVEALLSDNPLIGRKNQVTDARELVIAGTAYLVAYRVGPNRVEIVFVKHGKRQWPDDV